MSFECRLFIEMRFECRSKSSRWISLIWSSLLRFYTISLFNYKSFEVSNGWHFNQTFESSLIFYILIFDHGLAISFFTWWLWLPQYHWVFKNKHRIISHQINWFVRKHLRKSGLAVMLLWALTVVNAKWIDIKLWSMLTHCSVDCFRATQCKRYQCM